MTTTSASVAARLAWIGAIREPRSVVGWSLGDWERVVRLGRRLRLLARLAESIDAAGLMWQVPEQPRQHLLAERQLSRFRIAAMTWALERIRVAAEAPGTTLVLLKGAAYLAQGLPIAAGRVPSDVDILVPASQLQDVRSRLLAAHWSHAEMDQHDRRYYEEWSHEIPPMLHAVHPIELDLHHNVLPPTARTSVDAALLVERLRPSPWQGWQVLDPLDQVLHSSAHLFFDSEIRDRVRDLVDLDGLFRHFGTGPAFWDDLVARAHELGLAEPLALAVHFCVEWLGTPVPDRVLEALTNRHRSIPARWNSWLLGAILVPLEPDERESWERRAASWIFLARYHHWRMPMRLLFPHLAHKARVQITDRRGR